MSLHSVPEYVNAATVLVLLPQKIYRAIFPAPCTTNTYGTRSIAQHLKSLYKEERVEPKGL